MPNDHEPLIEFRAPAQALPVIEAELRRHGRRCQHLPGGYKTGGPRLMIFESDLPLAEALAKRYRATESLPSKPDRFARFQAIFLITILGGLVLYGLWRVFLG